MRLFGSLSLSLSLGACARVRSSPRVNTTKARTIRLRISSKNQTLNLKLNTNPKQNLSLGGSPKMSFPRKNGRRRERKKRYAKGLLDLPASIRAANDSARSNHPDEYLVSGRRRLFFTLGVQSAISRFFGLRMCLKLGKIRSRGATLDGCARGNGCERHRI